MVSGDIDENRFNLLDKFDYWSWDPAKDHWNSVFNYLEERSKSNGSYNPEPNKKINGRDVQTWISGQRTSINDGSITPDKLKKLQTLPNWEIKDPWDDIFLEVKEYYLKNYPKTFRDPKRHSDIGIWIHSQRTYYRNGTLLKDRIDKLASIKVSELHTEVMRV